jgi:hypothetical protein
MAVSIKSIRGGEEKGMDFSNRNSQPQPVAPSTHPAASSNQVNSGSHKAGRDFTNSKVYKAVSGVLLTAVVILIVAVVAYIGFGGSIKPEDSYVQTSKLQAVFLNTGQVYFGNIKALNSKYFVVDNIYYIQTSSSSTTTTTSSNTSVSLVKLGCELHAPYDQMVINSDQVTFWENLQPTGQVAKAVATFQKENPNGQKCSDQSAAAGSTSVQGSTTDTSDTTK